MICFSISIRRYIKSAAGGGAEQADEKNIMAKDRRGLRRAPPAGLRSVRPWFLVARRVRLRHEPAGDGLAALLHRLFDRVLGSAHIERAGGFTDPDRRLRLHHPGLDRRAALGPAGPDRHQR